MSRYDNRLTFFFALCNQTIMSSNRYYNQIRTLETVFQGIHEQFQSGRPVDKALTALFRQNKQFGSKDRRFISNAIFGLYRWYGWLQLLLPKETGCALALGYILDGHPVDDRVDDWFRKIEQEGRTLDPQLFSNSETLPEKAALFSSAVKPVSIEQLNPEFVTGWGMERIQAFQTRPPIWLRLDTADRSRLVSFLKSKQVQYRFHDRIQAALSLYSPVNLHESVDFREGGVDVQDLSSQAVGLICNPKMGDSWWDVCAGSGGKALHLSALMKGAGVVSATEMNSRLFAELKRRIGKNRNGTQIQPYRWDGKEIPNFGSKFDGVLVDAPCSCSGTWRRNPELRWRTSPEQVLQFARVQLNILKLCCEHVRDKGDLVYATCSLFPEENEQVIEQFLHSQPEFKPVPIKNPLTAQFIDGGLVLSPPESDGNGMFVAKLRKMG